MGPWADPDAGGDRIEPTTSEMVLSLEVGTGVPHPGIALLASAMFALRGTARFVGRVARRFDCRS